MKASNPEAEDLRILGLPENAGWREAQAAYRRLAMELHPDVRAAAGTSDDPVSSERFREINAAYERLRRQHLESRLHSRELLDRISDDPNAGALPIEELELRLRYSSSPQLRAAAALLLGRRPGARSRSALKAACRDADPQVRAAASEALREVGTTWERLWYPGRARLLAGLRR